MTAADCINALVTQKSQDLMKCSPRYRWAACASIWARVFVLGAAGWKRWPQHLVEVQEALSLALLRGTESCITEPTELLVASLESFDIEDDGSSEWQYVVDLIVMISAVIDGQDVSVCLQTALRSYLEGVWNVLANDYADVDGKPISVEEAGRRLTEDDEWKRAVEFVRAL